MFHKGFLKKNIRQIYAITEKEIYLSFRFKSYFFMSLLNPLIQLFVFFFLFGAIFAVSDISLGYWNSSNYLLFLIIAMTISYYQPITRRYSAVFIEEKYWNTLSAMIIAPVNRFAILIGILLSQIILGSLGVAFLFVIAYFIFPISIAQFLLFLLTLICVLFVFGSIGLIIGAFSISNENFQNYYLLFLRFVFLISCINYPKELFPEIIQFVISLNPLYYLIDVLRLIWYAGISPDVALLNLSFVHIISFVSLTILSPIIAVVMFERIYKKHGIVGY